ncbi:MAG: 2-amino-4-hydroxy-6-hydroxymethyldihydropteridine diphosphokinase [Gemmatimonadota bacterium]|nr:2-amino-4-hydroxy-6-hydroxymethyldihydropteridine diphosphokinase [Gemmatimonadota bacterium]
MSIEVAYIALGSNVGDRETHLAAARAALATLPRSRLLAESSIEETEPLGDVPQGPFLNQMIALETSLSPRELLVALQDIERRSGRIRDVRWGPRTIDLDIVMLRSPKMGASPSVSVAVNEPGLVVPHPAIPERDFWRRELAELERFA